MSDRCAGIKNPSDFFPICQRYIARYAKDLSCSTIQFDESLPRVSDLELCCNCQLMAAAHRTHFHTKTIATSAHLVFAPIQSRSNFIV